MAYLALLFGTRFFSRIGLYRTRSSYYARYSSCLMRLTTALGEVLLEPALVPVLVDPDCSASQERTRENEQSDRSVTVSHTVVS